MKNTGIYKITNIDNDKVYVGSSVNLKSRKYEHFRSLEKNKHGNDILQNSYNKHGKDSFKWEIIEYVEFNGNKAVLKKNILEREQYWIDELRVWDRGYGYNICKIAGCSSLGIVRSKEFCDQISKRQLGRECSEETRNKIKKTLTGHKVSEETRKKQSSIKKGVKPSEKTREKLIKASKSRDITDELRNKFREAGKLGGKSGGRKVKNVTTGIIFNSLTEAGSFYEVHRNSIGYVCKKKRKTAGGFIWEYLEERGD